MTTNEINTAAETLAASGFFKEIIAREENLLPRETRNADGTRINWDFVSADIHILLGGNLPESFDEIFDAAATIYTEQLNAEIEILTVA
jgi:hypothetical protein